MQSEKFVEFQIYIFAIGFELTKLNSDLTFYGLTECCLFLMLAIMMIFAPCEQIETLVSHSESFHFKI